MGRDKARTSDGRDLGDEPGHDIDAAVDEHGVITALDWDQLEDCGAYLRAPEPATLYRMHGNMTGAYRVPNLAIRNRVVTTNKTPSGLVRGLAGRRFISRWNG